MDLCVRHESPENFTGVGVGRPRGHHDGGIEISFCLLMDALTRLDRSVDAVSKSKWT
jgi:hypothetical protein